MGTDAKIFATKSSYVPHIAEIAIGRSGIAKDCFRKAGPKKTYDELAAHFQIKLEQTGLKKSLNKSAKLAAVGNESLLIQQALSDRCFTSLSELNDAIEDVLVDLNNTRLCEAAASRLDLFAVSELNALKTLPSTDYRYAVWKECGVAFDAHVEIFKNYYSVPYFFIREKLWARITAETVELFHNESAVACHVRSLGQRVHTTDKDHLATTHNAVVNWTPDRLFLEAGEIGPKTVKLLQRMVAAKRFPEQAFRSCVGVLRLKEKYGQARLEAAAFRALTIGVASLGAVSSILRHGSDIAFADAVDCNLVERINGQSFAAAVT